MSAQFLRRWGLSVGTLDVSDLDLAFKVTRSVRREPNLAEIRVFNLNRESRAQVEAGGVVVLSAGLGDLDPPRLFRGDSRDVYTTREGTDTVTTIIARDGGRAYSEARVSRSYAPGTSVATVLRDVVEALDIGEGNLADFTSSLALRNGADTFADGYVAAGPAHRVLSAIVRGGGLRWSVQNGALQILQRGTPLQARAVVLASDTGLLDSPSWSDKRRRRTVAAKALIQSGIEPGRKVRLESELITGDFEVRAGEYIGDTRGNDWDVSMELRAIG